MNQSIVAAVLCYTDTCNELMENPSDTTQDDIEQALIMHDNVFDLHIHGIHTPMIKHNPPYGDFC